LPTSKPTLADIKKTLITAKDAFYQTLDDTLKTTTTPVVTLKINIPGTPKNTWYTDVILRIMNHHLTTIYNTQSTLHHSAAGNYYLYTFDEDPLTLKHQLTHLESTHPLGRFVDLDVHIKQKTITRATIGAPPRSCYLCDEHAHTCARNQTHDILELRQHITHRVEDFLTDALAQEVGLALRKEVGLYPSFGLVSFKDSGAHTDMDYTHFLKSIDALRPYMKEFVEMGFNIEANLDIIRHIGKEAEASMYQATGNINTHKGAIFIFGAFLPFFTASIMHNRPLEDAINAMQTFIDHLTKDDFKNLKKKDTLTPGEIIYLKYGIQGIRDEVKNGFKSIMSWYPNSTYTDYQKLCAIMARVDDTTIIKRHNFKALRDVKTEMHALLNEHPFNMDYYIALSDQYKKKGISPGGSADLLSLVFFLDKTRYLLPEKITE
jgi:holo-ACP synthase/triphosphoribosyl-dephospho-CoA synthase